MITSQIEKFGPMRHQRVTCVLVLVNNTPTKGSELMPLALHLALYLLTAAEPETILMSVLTYSTC